MKKKLLIAADHGGYELKQSLISSNGDDFFDDLGTDTNKSVDYPDFAIKVVDRIKADTSLKGVLICGSGIGMSISANRHKGIRAAICNTPEMSFLARKHNDANILVLPGRFMDANTAKLCIDKFLNTDFEGDRHILRIEKIDR
tara:strand:- start:618 stop:1046 length:429 start_codon:yes stop_codon:yes gene_type:complete